MRMYLIPCLFLFPLAFYLSACGDMEGGPGGDYAGEGCGYSTCYRNKIGVISLSDTSLPWISHSGGAPLILSNGSGADFTYSYSIKNPEQSNLDVNPHRTTCPNGDSKTCYDYIQSQSQTVSYSSTVNPISIKMTRYKDGFGLPNKIDSSFNITSIKEMLRITVNNVDFDFPILRDTLPDNIVFYPTITLNGKSFDKVYYAYREPANTLGIKGVYFSSLSGFIGYTLTNNEKWIRK